MGRGASEARRSAELTPLTFSELAGHYKERHVQAKGLTIGATIDYRLKPLMDCFADWELSRIKTADIEDFIADLRKPRVVNRQENRTLSAASINRTIELLRHMLNWAVGREYLDRRPFRRGTETLIRRTRVVPISTTRRELRTHSSSGGLQEAGQLRSAPKWRFATARDDAGESTRCER